MLLPFGLCDACVHQRRVGNTRGSTFSLCGLARTDPRFPKYPRMPVLRCEGFRRSEGPTDGRAGEGVADGGTEVGAVGPRPSADPDRDVPTP